MNGIIDAWDKLCTSWVEAVAPIAQAAILLTPVFLLIWWAA